MYSYTWTIYVWESEADNITPIVTNINDIIILLPMSSPLCNSNLKIFKFCCFIIYSCIKNANIMVFLIFIISRKYE